MKRETRQRLMMVGLMLLVVATLLSFSLPEASSQQEQEQDYVQNQPVEISQTCHNNGSLCSSSASCNISVFSPKGVDLVNFEEMTQHPSLAHFNYTMNASLSSEVGDYRYDMTCGDSGNIDFGTFTFEVSAGGNDLDVADVLLYGLLFGAFVGIFFLTIWGYFRLDWKRKTDVNGLFTLKWEKYTKLFLLLIVYIEILFMLFVSWKSAETLVFLDFMSPLLYYFFILWLVIAAPMIIMVFIFTYVFVFTDRKLQKSIVRGVPLR